MKREIYKVYKDKRGWTYIVQCRLPDVGDRYYVPTLLKKGSFLFQFREIKGCHEWPTKEEAEKELKEYAEAHDMKAVL